MPIPTRTLVWQPRGLSDAVDGTNTFPGAMSALQNLIPDPSTQNAWICRPAALDKVNFPQSPGFISCFFVVGDIAYGLIADGSGYDLPFAVDLTNNNFLSISGISAGVAGGNRPASPPQTGPWTPPIMDQIGHRIIVTHPGFPGGAVKFGWFDVSNFSTSATGNTTAGSPIITGNPNILGVQPGMAITDGSNIAGGTTVVSTSYVNQNAVGSLTAASTSVTISTAGLSVGMTVAGNGIATGSVITAIGSGNITLNYAALATIASQLFFTGTTITMSQNALATTTSVGLTITSGTLSWGAGDTNLNPLPSVPLAVAQFNGRAYYALGSNGIVFSDAGLPTQVSNVPNVQALLPGNGLPVTCFGKLQLSSQLIGGIVQGLIAFQRDVNMLQITGDAALGTLAMQNLPVATGTHAPLAVFSCQLGVGFISPLGLRFVDFSGRVTEPVGYRGQGISMVFVLANNPPMGGSIDPSRMCAACNGNTARISVQNTASGVAVEYWYHINDKVFSGPHTSAASLIQMWSDTYLVAPWGHNALLRRSDDLPTWDGGYTEGGAVLNWVFESVLLPDNQSGVMNAIVESAVAMALPVSPSAITITFTDEGGGVIDQITVPGTTGSPPPFQQFGMDWHVPLVFKQAQIALSGQSTGRTRVGNLYLKIRPLGYQVALPVGYTGTTRGVPDPRPTIGG